MDGWCGGRSPRMLIWVVGIAREKATGSPPASARIFVTSFRIRVQPVPRPVLFPSKHNLLPNPLVSAVSLLAVLGTSRESLVLRTVTGSETCALITRPEDSRLYLPL